MYSVDSQSPSPLPRGFTGHVARPSRSVQPFNVREAIARSLLPVFLAIRSMSAIGIICHWSLAPPAATRFPSSIIIAVIVLAASRAIPSRPFDAKHLQRMIMAVVVLSVLVYLIFFR